MANSIGGNGSQDIHMCSQSLVSLAWAEERRLSSARRHPRVVSLARAKVPCIEVGKFLSQVIISEHPVRDLYVVRSPQNIGRRKVIRLALCGLAAKPVAREVQARHNVLIFQSAVEVPGRSF